MKKAIWIFALVSLLFVGMLPTVEAPNYGTPNWDVIYDVRNSYPEDETGWTRDTGGTIVRAFQYHNQILNVSLTGATSDFDRYTREIPESDYLIAEARLNMPTTAGHVILTFNTSTGVGYVARLSVQATHISLVITNPRGWTQTNDHYEENILGSNHTYTLITYKENGNTYIQGYYDHNLILQDYIDSEPVYTHFWFEFEEVSPVNVDKYCEWDYVAIRTTDLSQTIEDLEDEIDDLKREIDRLRRRLDEIDDGVIIVGENEPYVPPTREGLESDPSGYFFVDPFWTIFYSWHDSKAVGASMSFVACYDSGWSDYEALEDILYIAGSYTTLWLNSSGSEVLNTTDAYTYYKIPDANAGDAYTVETSGGNIKTDRYCRMKRVETFSWMVSEDKKDYAHTFALTNDLSVDWRNVLWVIAADPDTTMDQSTVVVTDTTTNTELDPGKHYEITPSCIRFQLSYHNQTVSESYEVEYSTFQEGSEYQEPRGIFNYDVASSASLNNRVYLFDEVAISNPNSIKVSVGTRITIQMSSIPGTINEIYVITADGSYLEQGPPLGNKWYTFYGLEIPANSVVTVSVYVKTQSAALEAEDLRPIGLLMFTAFFILTVSALIGWIATKSDKKLHKWTDPARGATFLFGLLTAVGFVVAFWSYG